MIARVLLAVFATLAGCETLPPTTLDVDARRHTPPAVTIVDPNEPGRRLEVNGRVLDYGGRPLPKAAVILYNADANGLYNPPNSPTRVPRIRGVAITDERGAFRFITVWPGAYPNNSEPAHLHLLVAAPAHHPLHRSYWFEGDPLITPQRRAALRNDAETKIVAPREGASVWSFSDNVKLEGN
jgi:protocatechuate 3,4-dioxygenase beta subunit